MSDAETDLPADPSRAQAIAFVGHLEALATQLAQQVEALEASAADPLARRRQRLVDDAKQRRLELYETRHHIEALQSRYGLEPCTS